ncbi:hypothetical protein [Bacteroides timonensis]|uniref:hypothetical protein n=1 Tax=Bacteroides timonensis TaxID=1470345 RepID=UPI0004ADCA87|nr:hypothetical protein [Bacteroides timonensis]
MKHSYYKLLSFLTCLLVMGMMATSCSSDKDKEEPTPEPVGEDNITVTNLTPTFNSVSFHVEAADAQYVAYLVDVKGSEHTASQVFTKGKQEKATSGDFTVQGLIGSTDYTLFVVSNGANGLGKVHTEDFKTTEDTGLPATTLSAGLRVNNFTETNAQIRVVNGADVDYSYVLVMPTVYMENLIMDVAQDDETGYLKTLATATEYGGQIKIEGANKTQVIDYNTDLQASLLPDAEYSVISVGITAEGEVETKGDLTRIDFRTTAYPLIGDPKVSIIIPEGQAKYIAIRYRYEPNADAEYFCRFATDYEQTEKFINYFDAKYGKGQGQEKLRQFVRFTDQYYGEHTEAFEESIKYGFAGSDHLFTMLALGLDKNLMPGKELTRVDDHLNDIPDKEKGEYTLTTPEIGANFLLMDAHLGKNCGAVFFRLIQGDGSGINTQDVDLALALYDEGWGMGPKTDQTITGDYTEFYHADVDPDTEYVLISTSLNYFGGLDTVRVSKPFKTLPLQKDAQTEVYTNISFIKATKSTATLHYRMAPEARLMHHRLLTSQRWHETDSDKPMITETEEQIRDFIMSEKYGETWSASDPAEADPREWDWQWTGMEPNTEYTYYYVTEDANGKISKLGKLVFKTIASEGGATPKVEFNVTDITAHACNFSITTNADVSSYLYMFLGDTEGKYTNMSGDELNAQLYNELKTQGISAIDDIVNREAPNLVAGTQYYAVVMPYGAEGKEGELTVIQFKTPSTRNAVQLAAARVAKMKSTKAAKISIKNVGTTTKSASSKIKKTLMKGKRPTMIVPQNNSAKEYSEYQYFDMKSAPLIWKKNN